MSKTEMAQRLARQKSDLITGKIEQLTQALDNLPVIIGQGISDQVQPVIEIRKELNELVTRFDHLGKLDTSVEEIRKAGIVAMKITKTLGRLEELAKRNTASHIKTAVITGLITGLVCGVLVASCIIFLPEIRVLI